MSRLSFTDMLGREVSLNHPPCRVVSLVPSQTELLHDLGLEEEVVGITKFCIHPEQWFRSKTRIGGTKNVHIDEVLALQPDLILANKEENVREQIEALAAHAPVWVSDIETLDDALVMIRAVGGLVGKEQEGLSIADRIAAGFASILKSTAEVTVAYGIWKDPWMWAGGDTFINDLIHRMGWKNVLADNPRYPAKPLEELALLRPQKIMLSSEPYPFKEKHIAEVRVALPQAEVILVDGELFSWYGSRLLHSPDYFASLLQTT